VFKSVRSDGTELNGHVAAVHSVLLRCTNCAKEQTNSSVHFCTVCFPEVYKESSVELS